MSKKVFGNWSKEEEQQYNREARLQYDPNIVRESHQRWDNYSDDQQEAIKEAGNQIYVDFAAAIEAGHAHDSDPVLIILQRWHEHLRYFYEPTLDILQGLGQLYNTSADFGDKFAEMHPELPNFLEQAITQYVDDLETAELERMLAEDDAMQNRLNTLSSDDM